MAGSGSQPGSAGGTAGGGDVGSGGDMGGHAGPGGAGGAAGHGGPVAPRPGSGGAGGPSGSSGPGPGGPGGPGGRAPGPGGAGGAAGRGGPGGPGGQPAGPDVPRAVLRSWDQAEARLFPLVMARPDLYQQSVSMIQLLLGYLRQTCPDLPSLLAAHERGGDLVAEGLASAQAGSAAASPGGPAGDRADEQAGDAADGDRTDEQAGDAADADRTDEQAGDAADADRTDEQAGDLAAGDRAAGDRAAGDRAAGDLAGAAAAWAASESGPRLDLVAAAACAMRYRELMASLAARHRLEALARAREQGETWAVAGETGSADLVPYTAYQRVEADVRTGRAVIVSIEPDETLTRAVHRLDAGHVDLVTGALRIGEQLGSYLNPDDLAAALRQARGEAER